MANFISTGPTRSQLVADFLQQQSQRRPRQISSFGEGAARLGADLVRALSEKKRIDDRLSQEQQGREAFGQAIIGNEEALNTIAALNPALALQIQSSLDQKKANKENREFSERELGLKEKSVGIQKPTQRSVKISELVERGFERNIAADIVDGFVKPVTDPLTGKTELFSVTKNVSGDNGADNQQSMNAQTSPTQVQPTTTKVQPEPVTLPLETRKDIETQNAEIDRLINLLPGMSGIVASGTGPGANLANVADTLSGLVGVRAFSDTVDNRNKVRQLTQTLKTGLVNNPRFPVAEQEIVQRMLPDPDTFFTNPEAEAAKLGSLFQFLQTKRIQNSQQLRGETVGGASQFGTQPQIVVNPSTNERMIFNENTGQWEPI